MTGFCALMEGLMGLGRHMRGLSFAAFLVPNVTCAKVFRACRPLDASLRRRALCILFVRGGGSHTPLED